MSWEGDSKTVTLRTGDEEILFESLEDMADDGYFESSTSAGIKCALSDYLGDEEFPRQDFRLYVEAREIAGDNKRAREEILDEKFFSRAVNEMLEDGNLRGLKRLKGLYKQEKY